MKIGKQSQPGVHHASTWLSGFISLPHLQAHPRLLLVCAHMCRCLWNVQNLLWQPPYRNFHKTWVRLRKSRSGLISKFVETWSVQGLSLRMYAPAFLSLNKKQSKSHDILKAKRLGSTDWRFLGVQNTLDPEALRLSMVPNINIPFLLVQGALRINNFWYPKSWKNYKFCVRAIK